MSELEQFVESRLNLAPFFGVLRTFVSFKERTFAATK
jgi:hypothetical protein